ncbi:MAG: chemotaxis protein CheX [Chthonomonas sp.]|nr:chemotaxis protein CheX [Chthonomonas sp.]
MRAEFVNPFVIGAGAVLKTLLGVDSKLGQLSARPTIFTTQEVNVVCGITGQVQGQVIYGMSFATAESVSDKMLGGVSDRSEELITSALAELGNMISGNCVTNLSSAGFVCDITPPTIMKGENVSISTVDIPALVIPLSLGEFGMIEINVSLRERAVAAAA